MLKMQFTGQTDEIRPCLSLLSEELGLTEGEGGLVVEVKKQETGGLHAEGKDGALTISYGTIPDFCRALCILLDFVKKDERTFDVQETRKTEACGIMADVSRNAVLRVDTVKDLIRRIARMGMDTFMLYMENIYRLEDYPYFGYMRGAYTEDELKEMDRYAQLFGVELVPCIQTLGHLKNALLWPYASKIKDTADILLVDEPETYKFIEAMISTLARCLSSEKIHIGMDESFGLGTGAYRRLHGEVDRFEILTRHLVQVKNILDKYGKKPMMWSDMYFRFGSAVGRYYDPEAVVPEHIKKMIPEGVTLSYWDYYHEDYDFYLAMMRAHQNMDCKIAFFGGVWTWSGITANYDKTFRTTEPAMRACRKAGIREIYATLWGDDGGETSIYTALLGMQLYAEYIYHDEVTREQLDRMFRVCTGYSSDTFLLLDVDNFPESEEFKRTARPVQSALMVSKQVLYQDVLQGLFDTQFENVKLREHYLGILKKLDEAEIPADLTELFEHHRQLVKALSIKCDIGIRITKCYQKGDKEGLSALVTELDRLTREMELVLDKFAALWLKNNKAFGLDMIDLRLGGAITRVKRAHDRIASYLNGEVTEIEELEEKKLPFSEGKFTHYQFADLMMSVSTKGPGG